jgi:phosphoserine phosphatase
MKVLPLAVDLDGTLIFEDVTILSLKKFFVRFAYKVPQLIFHWLYHGRGSAKHFVARHVAIDPSTLTYNKSVVAFLENEYAKGRIIVLATGASDIHANTVAQQFPFFREVIASNRECNMIGDNKAAHLCKRFGKADFCYAGNERVDLRVWKHAGEAIAVNTPKAVLEELYTYPLKVTVIN